MDHPSWNGAHLLSRNLHENLHQSTQLYARMQARQQTFSPKSASLDESARSIIAHSLGILANHMETISVSHHAVWYS